MTDAHATPSLTSAFPEEYPEDPSALLSALGLDAAISEDERAPLDAILGGIRTDLDAQQGPHRARSIVGKIWPVALAGVFLFASFFVLKPNAALGGLHLGASIAAALAGLLCLVATGLAPDRPGLSERLSLLGIVAAGAAVGIEAYLAFRMPMGTDGGVKCALITLAFAAVPVALLLFAIKRSGLPVRRLHATGIAAAGIAIAGASVWMHCPAGEAMHIITGHMVVPALIATALSLLLFRMFARMNKTTVL